ncbi:GH92 family glycosyl hydrolase [Edaphobacter albus]|uniref:GH92 family glycosyl hydrolase n=1 Tax=Edaphobacter sp. 4G125 TaxID=2763071 RepID=UPI001644B208|nr:GH92 family glycosyl hydrolase [Edaphobacter sp. 4G125]QNI36766.1 glycoside hydrolase family 92 protein [Edaphobacter sp. 4G125]
MRFYSVWPVLRNILGLSVLVTSLTMASSAQPQDAVSWVNPYIGTGDGPIGYGGTMPFVTPPFGMTNWTAQTRQNRLSVVSYEYSDTAIQGFMGTHQPAIWMGDYGYVTVVPQVGELETTPEARQMRFTHTDEIARPDYYSVWMTAKDGGRIRAEMTATERCAYMRFTFPKGSNGRVLVEASRPGIAGEAKFDATKHEITGYNPDRIDRNLGPFALPNFKGYFVVEFRKAWHDAKTYGMDSAGAHGAYADFASGEVVEVRVGTSFLSIDQARKNLRHEIPSWDFDAVQKKLRSTWNDKLSRVSVEGATDDQKKIVYTGLYHALLYPRIFSEYGRYYSAFDDKIHEGESYTAYSIWDTFRAENSLLTLLAPERIPGMITALLQNYKEGGWMPKWPNPSYTNIMIGTHADSLVAEAINKGFTGFDRKTAWDAVYKDAMVPPDGDTTRRWLDREPHTPYEARGGLTYYKQLGYIPTDKTDEASSRTIEDSYDDWCVAQVAKALGREKDYEFFLKRSLNYKNLYNPALGLMNGRTSDGKWAPIGGTRDTPGNRSVSGWTEGDAWVYTWASLHDLGGLKNLMGGAEKYNAKLDQHFAGGHNKHSNEPSHHYGYLYDYSGQPWKTQAKVREIANAEYANKPSGIDGDDDCGQMSAWYLFTAMGFYPVNPASGDYMIGSPMFGKMSLRLANGKTFTVIAKNNSSTNLYIQSATLNGKSLDKPVLTYNQIMQGSTVEFVMGPQPSKWASQWEPKAIAVK